VDINTNATAIRLTLCSVMWCDSQYPRNGASMPLNPTTVTFTLMYVLNWSFGATFVAHRHQTISPPPQAIPENTADRYMIEFVLKLKNSRNPIAMKKFTMSLTVIIFDLSKKRPQDSVLSTLKIDGIVTQAIDSTT
jgi:hypothetical protein